MYVDQDVLGKHPSKFRFFFFFLTDPHVYQRSIFKLCWPIARRVKRTKVWGFVIHTYIWYIPSVYRWWGERLQFAGWGLGRKNNAKSITIVYNASIISLHGYISTS